MKLSNYYRNKIVTELNEDTIDPWEWCPAINYILTILGFDDELDFDKKTQELRWKGAE